jgi:hypothetical protein
MSTPHDSKYLWVTTSTAAIWAAPWLFALILLAPYDKIPTQTHGLLRPQVGQTAILARSGRTNPNNEEILAAENLNRIIAEQVLANPATSSILRMANEEDIGNHLLKNQAETNLGEVANKLATGARFGSKWEPRAGPWGLFLREGENPPLNPEKPTFGVVELLGGAEKTRKNTESRINRLLFTLRQNKPWNPTSNQPVVELLQRATTQEMVTKEEAADLLGATEILAIGWDRENQLYLSKETALLLKELNQ